MKELWEGKIGNERGRRWQEVSEESEGEKGGDVTEERGERTWKKMENKKEKEGEGRRKKINRWERGSVWQSLKKWDQVGWLFGFYGISTFVGYLMLNPFLYK